MKSNLLKRKQNRGTDNLATPEEAILPLLPYIPKQYHIWECAAGEGKLASVFLDKGYVVTKSDKEKSFLEFDYEKQPTFGFDCIITNPPYSLKDEFLEKAYELKKPFAFLLPITAFEGIKRQKLYKENGLEVIFLPKRIDFTGKKAPWFAVAWFTNGLNIGRQLTFPPQR